MRGGTWQKVAMLTALVRGYVHTRRWGVRIERGVKIRAAGTLDLAPGSTIRRRARIFVGPEATLSLASGASIGALSTVNVLERVTIGAGSQVSWECQILDSDFHTLVRPDGSSKRVTIPIVIGEGVLIGSRASILKGTSIGDHSAVASGAVVFGRRDAYPAGSVLAGNPAKVRDSIMRIEF